MPTILLTRPRAQSKSLAAELGKKGYVCVIGPMLNILPLNNLPPSFDSVDSVMVTSGNALKALSNRMETVAPLLNLPCYCVGSRTAEAAQQFGFTETYHSDEGGAALASLMLEKSQAKHALYIAAREIASHGRDALVDANVKVTTWEVYTSELADDLNPETLARMYAHNIDAILVYSVRTAQNLNMLLERHKMVENCPEITAIGFSPAVSEALSGLPWKQVCTAAHPTEAAMTVCLERVCPGTKAQ